MKIRLPHVADDEPQDRRSPPTQHPKETQQRFGRAVRTDPQQTLVCLVQLIHHGLVVVPSMPLHLVDADGRDALQVTMLQAPRNCLFYRGVDAIPAHVKGRCHVLPTHPLGPPRQKPSVAGRHRAFSVGPRDTLRLHSARRTLHAPQGVEEADRNSPQRHELEPSLGKLVVTGPNLTATRADRSAVLTRPEFHFDRWPRGALDKAGFSVHKGLARFDAIENSFQLHPGLALGRTRFTTPSLPKTAQDALVDTRPSSQAAEREPAGCDRSRRGITGEQELVAQRLASSPSPCARGAGQTRSIQRRTSCS